MATGGNMNEAALLALADRTLAPRRAGYVVYGCNEPAVQHFHNCCREVVATAEAVSARP
jgi:hypothetical protein